MLQSTSNKINLDDIDFELTTYDSLIIDENKNNLNIIGADFKNCTFKDSVLINSNIERCSFVNCYFINVDLSRSNNKFIVYRL